MTNWHEERLLIDGALVPAAGGATYETINPATEEVLGAAADASVDDARRAIAAARRAFDTTEWSRDHGIRKVVLIAPPLLNFQTDPDWVSSADEVRRVLRGVADRYGAVCVDLAVFLRGRIARGQDPDFSRVRNTQSRSWHVEDGDPHLNAYGQRLVAAAFLAATADWRSSRGWRRLGLLRRGPSMRRRGP